MPRLARGAMSSRVVLNRQKVDELRLAVADGLLQVGNTIVNEANVPDATPYGQGLITTGAAVAYVDGRKVGGDATKPSGERTGKGIAGFAGFGFPGRFQEVGTVHADAQPFLWPSAMRVAPRVGQIMRPAVERRIGRRP